jgi:5-methylcytosine-specific restriction protein A
MANGFPPRKKVKKAILAFIRTRGGAVRTAHVIEGLADQFRLSKRARTRKVNYAQEGGHRQTAWGVSVRSLRSELVGIPHGLQHPRQRGRGIWALAGKKQKRMASVLVLPGEFKSRKQYREGSLIRVYVNKYERRPGAKRDCLRHWKAKCQVCKVDLAATYGPIAKGFIHVHHIKPLSKCGRGYQVDPIRDLRPVCPNCHAVIHLGGNCRSIKQVRALLKKTNTKK